MFVPIEAYAAEKRTEFLDLAITVGDAFEKAIKSGTAMQVTLVVGVEKDGDRFRPFIKVENQGA